MPALPARFSWLASPRLPGAGHRLDRRCILGEHVMTRAPFKSQRSPRIDANPGEWPIAVAAEQVVRPPTERAAATEQNGISRNNPRVIDENAASVSAARLRVADRDRSGQTSRPSLCTARSSFSSVQAVLPGRRPGLSAQLALLAEGERPRSPPVLIPPWRGMPLSASRRLLSNGIGQGDLCRNISLPIEPLMPIAPVAELLAPTAIGQATRHRAGVKRSRQLIG